MVSAEHAARLRASNSQTLSGNGTGLDFALFYASLGLRVFPCHSLRDGQCSCGGGPKCSPGKHPRTRNGVKSATIDQEQIREWWGRWPDANIAIATGNSLTVVDIDPRNGGDDSFAALEADLGPLPASWLVNTGGGGRHIYLHVPDGTAIRNRELRPGVDIQSFGKYIIAPPGNHVSGGIYQWSAPIALPYPKPIPAAWIGAITRQDSIQIGKRPVQYPPNTPHTSLSPVQTDGEWTPATLKRIRAVIKREAVMIQGTRNDRQMALVQQLDRIPQVRNAPAKSLFPFIERWYDASQANTKTPFSQVWAHFIYLWERWRNQDFRDAAELAFAAALSKPLPALARRYRSEAMRLLVALCAELRAHAGDSGVWFLSCYKAAELLGVDYRWANKCLRRLRSDGVIEQVGEYKQGSIWAMRYRYIGDTAIESTAAAKIGDQTIPEPLKCQMIELKSAA